MKYGAWSLPSGTAVIATGGRHALGLACGDAQESQPCANPAQTLDSRLPSHPPRYPARPAQWPCRRPCPAVRLESVCTYGGFIAHDVRDAARQDVAEESEAGPQHGIRRELPGERGSRLPDGQRRGRKDVPQMRLNHGVERLIDVVGDRIERPGKPRDFIMRVQRIGIQRVADADRPGQLAASPSRCPAHTGRGSES